MSGKINTKIQIFRKLGEKIHVVCTRFFRLATNKDQKNIDRFRIFEVS